jgi:hypothetical protein
VVGQAPGDQEGLLGVGMVEDMEGEVDRLAGQVLLRKPCFKYMAFSLLIFHAGLVVFNLCINAEMYRERLEYSSSIHFPVHRGQGREVFFPEGKILTSRA